MVCVLLCFALPVELLGQCEDQKLTAFDADQNDSFGVRVSVSDDVALIGAWSDECDAGPYCGSAYVYRFSPGTPGSWIYEQKLAAPDAADGDAYGLAVSVDGDLAVVGARGVDCAVGTDCGAAYIYRFNGSVWVEEQKLIASDPSAEALFGQSVSISGDVVVVGAFLRDCGAGPDCGAAYVYRFDGSTWVEEQRLTASDLAESALFGISVSIHLDVVIVGSIFSDCVAGPECGAAYIYRFDGATWIEEQKLTASDASPIDEFAWSVATESGLAVIGAPTDDCPAGVNCGAAYVFRFNGSTWVEEQKLTASDAGSIDLFGDSVAMHNGVVLVGTDRDDCATGMNCGAAYVYRFNGSKWVEERKLTAPAGAPFDFFGFSVAVTDDLAVIGAYGDGPPAVSGSIFAFTLGTDCNGNDRVDACDIRDGGSTDNDDDGIPDECQPVVVPLDIKPGKCPNRVNARSHGKLPVAAVGSHEFDVTLIDTDSLLLKRADGVGGSVRPLAGPPGPRIRFEDVATHIVSAGCDCHELGADGIQDLALKFSTSEMVEALQLDSSAPGASVRLTLTGSLHDGTSFEASDCILITGRSVTPLGVKVMDESLGVPTLAPHQRHSETIPTPVGRFRPKDLTALTAKRQSWLSRTYRRFTMWACTRLWFRIFGRRSWP